MEDISRPRDYERSDADPRLIGLLAVGIAVFLVATPLTLMAFYPDSLHVAVARPTPIPPAPQLQIDPKADLERLRSGEAGQLSGFGWTDSARRNVRIPIDRAMHLLAERGLPGWPARFDLPPVR